MNHRASFRLFLTVFCILSFSIIYTGCSASEETVAEDEMITDTGVTEDEAYYEEEASEEPVTEEQAIAEENQAPPEEEEQPEEIQQPEQAQPQATQQTEGPSREQLQADLDMLKTENVQLKEQLAASEQRNKLLVAKLSNLESANTAIKSQASEPKQTPTPHAAVAGKSSPQEIQAYESAVSMFNSKNYSGAISELQSLLNGGIKDDYADNCHYWIGVSSFQSKDYSTALQHFQQVMSYKYSEKRDDAQIMIARCYERLGEKDQAQAEYKKLIEMYPTSEWVSRARSKIR